MYLLDRATKIDEEINTLRSYLIEDGKINYVTTSFDKWNKQRVAMTGTIMTNGRIMFDDKLITCTNFQMFQERQSYLISKGCTGVAVAPRVQYEREIEGVFKRAKHAMASSTLDFLIGITLPLAMVRPSVIRLCQNLKVPFVRIEIHSFQELKTLAWTHISQTLLTYPTVLIPVIASASIRFELALLREWMAYCENFQIHTTGPIEPLDRWIKPFLQMVGLYPEKGTLLVGSDADYLLFHEDRDYELYSLNEKVATKDRIVYYDEKDPILVVVKGEIIKTYDTITLKPGFGRLIEVKRPGRFLSLSKVGEGENQKQSYM
ncbi:hypothetical protein [Halalkalibacter lacteus]|uniref:hypothetical protein n=1 Tax=Halalkalibacter lacteus TaxID=3090663 RepID=UPI002FCA440C